VHKHILAVGRKKCEYFCRLFRTTSFSESTDSTSYIELHPMAAAIFPLFLDFMYGNDEDDDRVDFEIITQTAIPLHHLGQYFENRRLRWLARQFWWSNMNFENCGTYLRHGRIFHNETVVQAVQDLCVSNVIAITPESSVIQELDLDLLWAIVRQGRANNTALESRHLSKLVARFCLDHAADLSIKTFKELTDPRTLQSIHGDAAIELMASESRIISANGISYTTNSLRDRCSEALSNDWLDINFQNRRCRESICDLDPGVLSSCLAHSQNRSLNISDHNELLETNNCALKLRTRSLEATVDDLQREVRDLKREQNRLISADKIIRRRLSHMHNDDDSD
jgi:hypothetical protein